MLFHVHLLFVIPVVPLIKVPSKKVLTYFWSTNNTNELSSSNTGSYVTLVYAGILEEKVNGTVDMLFVSVKLLMFT